MKKILILLVSLLIVEGCTRKTGEKKSTVDPLLQANENLDPATSFHFPAPCQECHNEVRPAPPHNQNADCFGCHAYPDWKGVATSFNHEPPPESCLGCHAEDRPGLPHPADGDCVSCHAFPSFGILIGDASFSHTPKPESCEQCHARPKEVGERAYPNQGPPAGFNADDANALGGGHYVGKDCLECHRTPDEGATAFDFTHASPRAEFCLPCHYNEGLDEHRNRNNVTLSDFGNCYECHKNFDETEGRNWRRGNGNNGNN